jgi:hypothetical protein
MGSNASAVAMRPVMEMTSEERFSREDIALMRETVCRGASDPEFRQFLNQCVRTGLDPLARQIYSIPRGNSRTIQTGIDGYRLVAQRTGEYAGSDDAVYDSDGALVGIQTGRGTGPDVAEDAVPDDRKMRGSPVAA